jgi:hypothetical protein
MERWCPPVLGTPGCLILAAGLLASSSSRTAVSSSLWPRWAGPKRRSANYAWHTGTGPTQVLPETARRGDDRQTFHCGTASRKDPMGPGASSVLRRNAPFRPQLRALDGPEHQSGGRRTRGQRMECVAGRRDQSVRRGGGVRPGRRTADGPGTTDEPHAGLWRSGGRRLRQPPRSRTEWAHADAPCRDRTAGGRFGVGAPAM